MTSSSKTVVKTFRALGARRFGPHDHGTSWRFPDDATKHVPDNITPATARNMIGWAEDRYGVKNTRPIFDGERVKGRKKPVLDLTRLEASVHAKERLTLMREQANVEYQEIILALRAPQRVLYSDTHRSWIWVGERIAVAASVHSDGSARISTLLWTTRELWDANPRPTEGARR